MCHGPPLSAVTRGTARHCRPLQSSACGILRHAARPAAIGRYTRHGPPLSAVTEERLRALAACGTARRCRPLHGARLAERHGPPFSAVTEDRLRHPAPCGTARRCRPLQRSACGLLPHVARRFKPSTLRGTARCCRPLLSNASSFFPCVGGGHGSGDHAKYDGHAARGDGRGARGSGYDAFGRGDGEYDTDAAVIMARMVAAMARAQEPQLARASVGACFKGCLHREQRGAAGSSRPRGARSSPWQAYILINPRASTLHFTGRLTMKFVCVSEGVG